MTKRSAVRRRTVTNQQQIISRNGLLDLSTGYPLIEMSGEISRLFDLAAADVVSLFGVDAHLLVKERRAAYVELVNALRRVLSIKADALEFTHCVSTGSLALDRALSAMISLSAMEGKVDVHVIGTSPAFDVARLAIHEKRAMKFEAAPVGLDLAIAPVDELIKAASQIRHESLGVILVGSPENPTGAVISEQNLFRIMLLCKERGFVLLVDHCFLHAGVQLPGALTPVWTVPSDFPKMIAIWDTGKLIGVGGHKLGFILTSTPELNLCVTNAIQILQYELPILDLLFFKRLFESDAYFQEVTRVREICRENLRWVRGSGFFLAKCLVEPAGSSVALVDVSKAGYTDLELQEKLAARGVGVLAAGSFFDDDHPDHRFIRISLARDSAYFREAAKVIDAALKEGIQP